MAVVDVTESTFADEVLKSDELVVVDYWADWCAPCKQLSPIIEELSGTYAGQVKFVKVDTSAVGTGSATVMGYLANSTGGKLVAGSTITVERADGSALTGTTNAEGKFTLKLDPGVYTVSFKKDGYAASRIEGLRVVAGENMPLNAIQKNAFATTLPVNDEMVVAPAGGADAAAAALSAASCTSCLRTRPPTPVPVREERSTPRSLAILRTNGVT